MKAKWTYNCKGTVAKLTVGDMVIGLGFSPQEVEDLLEVLLAQRTCQ
jgi:hypothetical protein